MATTVRSIGAMPFQGGQFTGTAQAHAMVRLTNSRIVWTYYQTSPNWLAASVIDVPGGITGTGAPVITNQQLLFPLTQNGPTTCAKLNQNTFLIVTGPTTGASAFTGAMSWFVMEVDTGGVFTRVDQGQFNFGTSTTAAATHSFGFNNFKVVELKENLVMYMSPNLGGTTSNIGSVKGVYDPVAKKMTWDTAVTNLFQMKQTSNNGEFIVRSIPGRDMTLVQFRYIASSGGNTLDMRGTSGVVLNNQNGAIVTPATKLPVNDYVSATTGPGDMTPLPGDRIAVLRNNFTIQWYSMDYINGSFIDLGTSSFTAALSPDIQGHYLMPLTTDYVLKMIRVPMNSAAGHRFKVIRRVDQNLSEQSPASSANGGAGFTTSAVTSTVACLNQTYPEFIDGKVVYFGLDSATAATKFSWTVLGIEPPSA